MSDRSHMRMARWALSAFLLFCVPIGVYAIPLSEYRNDLRRAETALDTLNQVDESETEDAYSSRIAKTVAMLKNLIPANQGVENGDNTLTVDNLWFHQELDDYQRSQPDLRAIKLSMLLERVKALEERVDELQKPAAAGSSKGESKERISEILNRPEFAYQSSGQNALNKLLRDFIRWIQSWFPKMQPLEPGRAFWVSRVAQILVVVLATGLIAFVVFQLLSRWKRRKTTEEKTIRLPRVVLGEELQPEDSATDLLSEAEALARKGELRAAIRKAYIAILVELGDRKVLQLAQHKTNRDYLKAVSSLPVLHLYMSGMTDSFERHWYGLSPATAEDWQHFRESYQAARGAKV